MSKTFCVQPWLGKDLPSPFLDKSQYDNSSFRYCCWMTYDYDIEKVRQDLLDGVPNVGKQNNVESLVKDK